MINRKATPKKYLALPTIVLIICMTVAPLTQCRAGLIGSIIAKVIRAIDINIQKLQNKTIVLQNAQKLLENQLSKLKLGEITSWAGKETALFSSYYGELAKVKAALLTYKKIKYIMEMQVQIFASYKSAFGLLKKDAHFTPDEISYMSGVYIHLTQRSMENLEELLMVISSFKTNMNDGKRLEFIASVATKMETVRTDLLQFNRQNMQVSLNRSASQEEAAAVKKYYGLP
jgi:hypothetical protein